MRRGPEPIITVSLADRVKNLGVRPYVTDLWGYDDQGGQVRIVSADAHDRNEKWIDPDVLEKIDERPTIWFGPYENLPLQWHMDCKLTVPAVNTFPKDMEAVAKTIKRSFWTNNPYWLDHFDPDQIVLALAGRNYLIVSEHPQWERWKGQMAPGEFVSTHGDKSFPNGSRW